MKKTKKQEQPTPPKPDTDYIVTYRFKSPDGAWHLTMGSARGFGRADHRGVKKRFLEDHPGVDVNKVIVQHHI